MRIQAWVSENDFEILTDFCDTENVSVSGLLCTLLSDFLDSADKTHIADVISRAKKIKQGRPKEGDY